MSYELKGTLKEIFATEEVSEKFKKREFVVETSETVGDNTYTEEIKCQLVQDKCSALDGLKKGDEVNVSFNIKGRSWENKEGKVMYFTNIDAWRIESLGSGSANASSGSGDGSSSDLPF